MVEKNKILKAKKSENYFSIITKYPLLTLLLIGIGAIIIRLVFFQNEIIFPGDNIQYFKYGMDVSLTGELPTSYVQQNNGWQLFISIFFHFFESKNFLDYMNLQSYISIVISTLTIIPLYFLAKKFTSSSFALITTILFIFEPRIIENSLVGVTDPLFILLIVTSLALVVHKNKFIIYGACITIGLACIVRTEGLFLIPTLCTMFLIKNKITKINIIQCVIFIIIIYLIILPFSMQRIENSGDDYLVSRIIDSSSIFSEQTQNEPNQIFSKIGESFYIFTGFFGRLMIPYLIIFVPLGIILFLKGKNKQKLLLIVPVFFMILPSLYAYTVPALDSRYLFSILPILCIFGTFACMKYFQNFKYKKLIVVTIIIIIIFSSTLFLIYKDNGTENQKEFLEFAKIINKNTDIILYTPTPIFNYLEAAELLELKEFPVMSSYYADPDSVQSILESYSNIEDFFILMEKRGITHIIFDEEIDNSMIIKEIVENYEENKNLKKIFDSQENGFDYKIKIFEIKY